MRFLYLAIHDPKQDHLIAGVPFEEWEARAPAVCGQ